MEDKLKLELVLDGDGVDVMCNDFYLIRIKNDGTVYRYSGVPKTFGFQLDEKGRILYD